MFKFQSLVSRLKIQKAINMANLRNLVKKQSFSLWIIIAVLCFILPLGGCLAQEESLPGTPNVFLPASLIYDNVFWAAGQNVNLNSAMKDDVYLAGASVIVSGPIDGDLIVAGSNVVINSTIKGDLRAAAASLTINGKIEGNITVLAATVNIGQQAEIGKNAIILGGNVESYGKINKNLYSAAGNLLIDNEISGSVYATIDSEGYITLLPTAVINGNLEYTAPKSADLQAGSQIKGEVKFTEAKIEPQKPVVPKEVFSIFSLTFWLIGLLGSIVVGLVVIFVFKDLAVKMKQALEKNIAINILKGFLYLIAIPIALLILAVTVIGLPLSMILLPLYFIAIYLCRIFIGVYVGEKILIHIFKQKEPALAWSMMTGLMAISLLCLIPILGIFVRLVIVLWGLGTLAIVLKQELKLENN